MNRFIEWAGMRNLMMLLGVASAIGAGIAAGEPTGAAAAAGFGASFGLCMVAAAIAHAAEAKKQQAHDDKPE